MTGHTPGVSQDASGLSLEAAEALLADWFEAPVVLASSGRGAMLLYLAATGHSRYRDRIAVPRMISTCVLEAIVRRGYPVDPAQAGGEPPATSILYHQYGIPQVLRPSGRVLEDISHAFFASRGRTGARPWAGDAAVFSLPKFLAMSSMAGGLVVRDKALEQRLRETIAAAPAVAPELRERQARDFRECYGTGGPRLEVMYLERLINPRISADELGGLPHRLQDLQEIGRMRAATTEALIAACPGASLPDGWRALLRDALPFALPVLGDAGSLAPAIRELARAGVDPSLYRIDIARNMAAPRLQQALLLPCHHAIPAETLRWMTEALAKLQGGQRLAEVA